MRIPSDDLDTVRGLVNFRFGFVGIDPRRILSFLKPVCNLPVCSMSVQLLILLVLLVELFEIRNFACWLLSNLQMGWCLWDLGQNLLILHLVLNLIMVVLDAKTQMMLQCEE